MLKFDPAQPDINAYCHSRINSSFHACGVAKAGYFDAANHQGCIGPLDSTFQSQGWLGYSGFSPRSEFMQLLQQGDALNCNATNAVVCCSPQC